MDDFNFNNDYNENNEDNVIQFRLSDEEHEEDIDHADAAEHNIRKALLRSRLIRIIKISIVVLLVAATISIFMYYSKNRTYNGFDVRYSRIKSEVMAEYESFCDSLLRYGKDGAILIDNNGKEIFNESYHMKSPIIDVCEGYCAIADLDGNTMCLFSAKGIQATINSSLPIKAVRVSENGIVMLISENESATFISFYDKKANILAESKYPLEKKRFPADFDISYDGLRAAIGFIGYDKNELTGQIAIIGFDALSSTKPNNVIFSMDMEGELPTLVKYNSNGALLVAGSSKISIISPDKDGFNVQDIELNLDIASILTNDKYIVVVENTDAERIAHFYNYKSQNISNIQLDLDYQHIVLNDDWLVITKDEHFKAYDLKGHLRVNQGMTYTIKDVKIMENKLKYLMVYDGKLEAIKLN